MQPNSNPNSGSNPNPGTDPISAPPAKPPIPWLRYAIIAAVSLLLAWPVVYLVVRRAKGYPGQSIYHPQQSVPTIAELAATASARLSQPNRIHLSALYLNSHQPARAIPLLRSILAENSNNADAWNNLCDAYNQTQRYNLATQACTLALRLQPSFTLARNNLAFAVSQIQTTQSILAAQQRVAPSSRNAAFYIAVGLNYLHIGRYHHAIHAWQQALALDPHNAPAANNIGIAWMFLHKPAQAIPWFQKAIDFDPQMQLAKNNLAWGRQELAKAVPVSR